MMSNAEKECMFEEYVEKIVEEYLEEHRDYEDYVGCRDIGRE